MSSSQHQLFVESTVDRFFLRVSSIAEHQQAVAELESEWSVADPLLEEFLFHLDTIQGLSTLGSFTVMFHDSGTAHVHDKDSHTYAFGSLSTCLHLVRSCILHT